MHYNRVMANNVLDTQKTDAKGCVEFETSDLQKKNGGSLPSIFFLAKTKGISIGPNKLPDEWPTKAWKARDGQPGFWKDFVGNRLGYAIAATAIMMPFLLALILIRKKLLVCERSSSNAMFVRPRGSAKPIDGGELIEVMDPKLDAPAIERISARLAAVLEG